MIKMLLLNIATSALQRMLDKGIGLQIQEAVTAAMSLKISGEEKRQKVMEELRDVGDVMGESIAESSPWLVSAIIELIVGKHKLSM